MNKYIIIAYAIWNIGVFFLYGIDKLKAKRGAWRIPESTLLICALLFGAVGAYLGMKKFRHKTKHTSFKILVPLFVFLNLATIAFFGFAPKQTADLLSDLFL